MKTFDFVGLEIPSTVRDASKPRLLPPLSKVSRNSKASDHENTSELDIYGYPVGFLDHMVKITSGLPITPAELVKRLAVDQYRWLMDLSISEGREYVEDVIEGRAF